MKRNDRRLTTLAAATLVATLCGCSSVSDMLQGDRVKYKDAGTAPNLVVPPGLSDVQANKQRYVAPPSTAGLGSNPRLSQTPDGGTTLGVPTASDPYGMHFEYDGNQRWLVVDGRDPDQLWGDLKAFWEANGFAVVTDAPATGVLETDWAENRANIPNDWFRKTVGKLLDWAYSSGTRDKFRTRVERTPDGGTEIFITHRGMEEVLTGRYQESSRWVERPRNPQLENAFLQLLAEKFGVSAERAKQLADNPRQANAGERIVSTDANGLVLTEPVDRAWLRVGLALDRSNFVVDRSDRATGVFVVRYANPNEEVDQNGLFSKLFGRKPTKQDETRQYRVAVRADASGRTRVSVLDESGNPDGSSDAQRIVAALKNQLS
ncbi:outer membrane protein assembly factor BamC [Chitinasiproducens palmae]|uniref:Beta-barrel assembly machine subunit BamC n=1 Tax=Chitinasiproducens palmae TaxID=1770053 RepID=A0A1H2PRY2_9BURK|nr:outer membrane protein assembly factor BamC [Chitinasiproducens palmae]SDV49306.1 Beta-barrel assembly machine subunit BamC [Chitinasiproducens palmae]